MILPARPKCPTVSAKSLCSHGTRTRGGHHKRRTDVPRREVSEAWSHGKVEEGKECVHGPVTHWSVFSSANWGINSNSSLLNSEWYRLKVITLRHSFVSCQARYKQLLLLMNIQSVLEMRDTIILLLKSNSENSCFLQIQFLLLWKLLFFPFCCSFIFYSLN